MDTAKCADGDLVVQARAGDARAREALFRRHLRRLRGVAARLGSIQAEPDDLVQEAVADALENLSDLEHPQAFQQWLTGIVVRKAFMGFRRGRVRARYAQEVTWLAPPAFDPTAPEAWVELRGLTEALVGLPDRVTRAAYLRRVEGMKLREVAREMGVSLATVKRWLKEADEKVREIRAV